MSAGFEGGCTCRAIRYRMTERPLFVHCCHGRWCQRESGAAFALNALIESDRVELLSGTPETILTPSASGKGQRIGYCAFATPIGTVLIAATDKGLCSLKIGDDEPRLARQLAAEFGEAEIVRQELGDLKQRILSFIDGEASLSRVPLDIRGTVFQRRVWRELQRIPRGATRTYAEIARAIGAPRAVRAVGSACGANPVALAVPCHRAVRTDGGLGGYAWGLQRKKRLLQIEKGKK